MSYLSTPHGELETEEVQEIVSALEDAFQLHTVN